MYIFSKIYFHIDNIEKCVLPPIKHTYLYYSIMVMLSWCDLLIENVSVEKIIN